MRAAVRFAVLALAVGGAAGCSSERPTPAKLGALVFADTSLSTPAGQGCADCHAQTTAFRDPESDRSTSMGAVAGRFGARNAPSAMYARFVPPLHYDAATRGWSGGLFWDGRASSLEQQAGMPMLHPLEMNSPDKASVVRAVRRA